MSIGDPLGLTSTASSASAASEGRAAMQKARPVGVGSRPLSDAAVARYSRERLAQHSRFNVSVTQASGGVPGIWIKLAEEGKEGLLERLLGVGSVGGVSDRDT